MTESLDSLVCVLQAELVKYRSIRAMAEDVGVPYDTLYAILNERRARSVDLAVLQKLAHRFPAVAALFLPKRLRIGMETLGALPTSTSCQE